MTSLRPFIQEAESEDEPIIGAVVNEVVKQLLAGRVPGGGNEMQHEFLNSLDVVGVSWLTHKSLAQCLVW